MSNDIAYDYDVVIIGAGPSGSVAAAMLLQKGYSVCVVEKQTFPRFSIGESLLPQCMEYLNDAKLIDVVKAHGFQQKDGANFHWNGAHTSFDFSDKSTEGPSKTFEVIRADFDKILIDEVEKKGAEVRYNCSVIDAKFDKDKSVLTLDDGQTKSKITAKFCLDASGFGRVLARILKLDKPSSFPPRRSYFAHIQDHIDHPQFNRNRILINVHPKHKDVWYWVIPFSNGTSSIGVVGNINYFNNGMTEGQSNLDILKHYLYDDPYLKEILIGSTFEKPVQSIEGYSCSVQSLYGDGYALLGNAAEFLDPVFSSGVTIAMKSAVLAAATIDKQLKGTVVCWNADFATPLMVGVNTFRAFVESWYEEKLIDIFFSEANRGENIRRHLTSILAGYVWDKNNPFVTHTKRRLNSLHGVCK